jgi:hypothetical protein
MWGLPRRCRLSSLSSAGIRRACVMTLHDIALPTVTDKEMRT